MNLLKLRLDTLRSYYQQYEQASGNPHLQNAIVGAMRLECDRLNLSVVDYILEMQAKPDPAQAKPQGAAEQKPVSAESKDKTAPVTGPVLPAAGAAFSCSFCGKEFATQKALSGHQKGHRKEAAAREAAPAMELFAAGNR